jgi:sterol 3beta-glucosyltransferase
MRIALLASGSRGDIQPLLAVADALRDRGHRVRMTVNTNLVAWARPTALELVPLEPDSEGVLKSDEGRALLATGKLVRLFRAMAEQEHRHNDQIIAACREATRDADVVVSTVLTVYRGQCFAERLGVPHGVVSTVPYLGTGRWASFVSPRPNLGLGWLNRVTYPLMHAVMWREARPSIAHLRDVLGLSRLRARPRVERLRSAQLYSSALLPRQKEWGSEHELAGFCVLRPELRASLGEGEVAPDLEAWLEAGPPPVYFGFGSMPILDPERVLGWVDAIVRQRKLRALVGAGWSDYGITPGPRSEHLFVAPAFNHDRVLPRCLAAVHHGGAGTTAAALRAGLPSAVLSVFGDQPLWGWRVARLGVGTTLRFQALTEQRLARSLDALLRDDVRERAQGLAQKLAGEDGATRTAEIIESWGRVGTVQRSAS